MIINMGGGNGINANLIEFTVDSLINDRNLIVDNVDVPGGVIHGYALMLSARQYGVITSGQIMSLYADLEKARQKAETLSYFSGSDVYIRKVDILAQAYSYDAATKQLTFTRFSDYVFVAGTYSLLIW